MDHEVVGGTAKSSTQTEMEIRSSVGEKELVSIGVGPQGETV
jgi:hypothetical protein